MLDLTKNSPDSSVGHSSSLPPKRTGFVLGWSQGSREDRILGKKLNCGLETIVSKIFHGLFCFSRLRQTLVCAD